MNEIDVYAPDSGLSMISEPLFGIQDGRPAFVTTEGELKGWNAVVNEALGLRISGTLSLTPTRANCLNILWGLEGQVRCWQKRKRVEE